MDYKNYLNYLPYKIANQTKNLQKKVLEIEKILFNSKIKNINVKNPLYVCGLARSGTTIITHIINSTEKYGSALYRDMPFLFIPIFWKYFGFLFYKGTIKAQRHHGDDIYNDPDSPDAFEEIIWSNYIKNYEKNITQEINIKDISDDFVTQYLSFIKKILYLRNKKAYLAKGNYNIKRIKLIKQIIPGAKFIICIRDPIEQSISMTKTHLHFIKISKKDKFFDYQLDFMKHYEFGNNRKSYVDENQVPINIRNNFRYYLDQWIIVNKYLLKYLKNNYNENDILILNHINFSDLNKKKLIKNLSLFCELDENELSKIIGENYKDQKNNKKEIKHKQVEVAYQIFSELLNYEKK